MELRQLEAYVCIASLRSFRAAANRLNITQPAISLRIRSLETELNTELFERNSQAVRLTPKGLEFLPNAEAILDGVQKLKSTAAGTSRTPRKVRIGATSTMASAWLPRLLKQVMDLSDEIALDLVVDTTSVLREKLMNGSLDVAIVMGPMHEANIRNLPLATYRNRWVANASLGLGEGRLSINQLAKMSILTYSKLSATYGSMEEIFRMAGLWPVRLSSFNSAATILRLVEMGAGIGVVSEALLQEEMSDAIQILDCEIALPNYEYFVSYHLDSINRSGMLVAEVAKAMLRDS